MPSTLRNDDDAGKGAVEQDRPEQKTNVSFPGQNPHRTENRLIKANDTDYPEPGSNVEHSGELMPSDKDRKIEKRQNQADDPDAEFEDQDPGQRQRRNQNDEKDDPLAA